MTIRLSLFAFLLVASLATTASAVSITGDPEGPDMLSLDREAWRYFFLQRVANAERKKKAARQLLSEKSPEGREEILEEIARQLGQFAGHLNNFAAKAVAPETREDVLLLVVEKICGRAKQDGWLLNGDEERLWWALRCQEMEASGSVFRPYRENTFFLDLFFMEPKAMESKVWKEYREKIMRRWISEFSPEDRSEMMVKGTRWLTELTEDLNELAAKAASPETREEVFVLIAQQKKCGQRFSFTDSLPFYRLPWCGYLRE